MSLDLVLFIILGTMAIVSALGVIIRKNPITAAMLLVVHFIALSGLYLTLSAQFLAVIQMLIYAGAIMVLVVFVIMLLNLGREEPVSSGLRSREGLSIVLVMALGGILVFVFSRTLQAKTTGVDLQHRVANGSIESIGRALFTTYVFPFEMIALVLLAAVVGAVVLTKRHMEE